MKPVTTVLEDVFFWGIIPVVVGWLCTEYIYFGRWLMTFSRRFCVVHIPSHRAGAAGRWFRTHRRKSSKWARLGSMSIFNYRIAPYTLLNIDEAQFKFILRTTARHDLKYQSHVSTSVSLFVNLPLISTSFTTALRRQIPTWVSKIKASHDPNGGHEDTRKSLRW